MWRIGFRFWSAWQYARLGGGGALVLGLVWLAQGFSALFWLVALAAVAVVAGARAVLIDLDRRETPAPDRGGRR